MYYLHVGVVYGKLKTSINNHEIVDSEVGVYLQKTAIENQMQQIQKEMSI